jgi:hypothetical protein
MAAIRNVVGAGGGAGGGTGLGAGGGAGWLGAGVGVGVGLGAGFATASGAVSARARIPKARRFMAAVSIERARRARDSAAKSGPAACAPLTCGKIGAVVREAGMPSHRTLLVLAALPALGFTDCSTFSQVAVPAADGDAPLSCVEILRPRSGAPPEIYCGPSPRFEATPADPIVVVPFALDSGGVRAMRMYRRTVCDPAPPPGSGAGWLPPVDFPPICVDKLEPPSDGPPPPPPLVPPLPARYRCGLADDLQAGDVGSLVSDGMYLATEVGEPACPDRGHTVEIHTYAIDFWNNESRSYAEVHVTP